MTLFHGSAPIPAPVREQVSSILGVRLVTLNSKIFGWVERAQLFWIRGPRAVSVAELFLPDGFEYCSAEGDHFGRVQSTCKSLPLIASL